MACGGWIGLRGQRFDLFIFLLHCRIWLPHKLDMAFSRQDLVGGWLGPTSKKKKKLPAVVRSYRGRPCLAKCGRRSGYFVGHNRPCLAAFSQIGPWDMVNSCRIGLCCPIRQCGLTWQGDQIWQPPARSICRCGIWPSPGHIWSTRRSRGGRDGDKHIIGEEDKEVSVVELLASVDNPGKEGGWDRGCGEEVEDGLSVGGGESRSLS